MTIWMKWKLRTMLHVETSMQWQWVSCGRLAMANNVCIPACLYTLLHSRPRPRAGHTSIYWWLKFRFTVWAHTFAKALGPNHFFFWIVTISAGFWWKKRRYKYFAIQYNSDGTIACHIHETYQMINGLYLCYANSHMYCPYDLIYA
jgi:hypothetical protein